MLRGFAVVAPRGGGVPTRQVGGEPRMPGSGSAGAQTNGGAVEDTRLAYESHPGGVHLFECGKCGGT